MGRTNNKSLRSTIERTGGGRFRAVLSGAVDEGADLDGLFAQLTGDAVINLQRVERLNSMGVHNWIPLIRELSSKHQVVIEELSYAWVQNAISVSNLFGSADVVSCMAPYFCTTCNTNVTLPVTREEAAAANGAAPSKLCDRCKSELVFDDIDGYFSFFKVPPPQ